MQDAIRLDLASFEDPVFYDKLEHGRRRTTGRLALRVALLTLGQNTLTLASLSAGLIVFAPWLMALLVAAIISTFIFIGETHFTTRAYSVLSGIPASALFSVDAVSEVSYSNGHRRQSVPGWTPQRRDLDYLRMLGASHQSTKDVKIFGLGDYLAERYRTVSDRVFQENRAVAIKRASLGSLLNLRATGGYYGAYLVPLSQALRTLVSAWRYVISHGFSPVRVADRMLVRENGGFCEKGTHHQRVSRGGRYAELFELQTAS